jgi:hypothetical protein
MLWGNPKSIDRIDRGIFHRGKRPAKCHIPTRSIRERYLSWRSVPIRLRSIYYTIYQPHESPANGHIEDGAGDAGSTSRYLLGMFYFLPRPPHRLGPFKAILNVAVTEERTLEDLGA